VARKVLRPAAATTPSNPTAPATREGTCRPLAELRHTVSHSCLALLRRALHCRYLGELESHPETLEPSPTSSRPLLSRTHSYFCP
jgi:hypothetical protein